MAFTAAWTQKHANLVRRDLAMKASQYFCYAAVLDFVGIIFSLLPLMLFPDVGKIVSEALRF
eukprot:CAMPEP_0169281786 /NCGR_PEP_ID=MMETSP1016-20121227/56482_1 /TAXON_ID=342587 /ORGANISM="Karlodinium micrum, Strain CCMP2283" /LENGTH=61 /DNA_ID=CAMNT_0009370513 /DNA_START=1 /DNA_END=183 /DNA_ORIENTATION=+